MSVVTQKATVNGNVNSHRWQDFGGSESYSYRVKKVVDEPAKEMLNVAGLHFSQRGGERENDVLHCVVGP